MACPTPSLVTQPFAQFGDANNYFPIPGGSSANAGLPVLRLADASIVAGGDPFDVDGVSSDDKQSVLIDAGGSATSLPFCVDTTMPTFRFFAVEPSAGADLQVRLSWLSGFRLRSETVATIADGSASDWVAVEAISLAPALGLAPGGSTYAVLTFSVPGSSGSWQLDDVYVDPYRSS